MIKTNEFQSESLTIEIGETNFAKEQLFDIRKHAAELAHEIRNPLTTIKGFLELLKPSLRDMGRDEYADIALNEIERVNDIINHFLNDIKPNQCNKELLSINEILMNIVKLFESESKIKNIELLIDFSEEDIQISIDKNAFKQVLINLIKNAIEAIEENSTHTGFITIRTEKDEQQVFIHIIDNGCGMSSDTINQLFTPFYTTKTNGTGIGLSVCKDIIDYYKGNISIVTDQNKGSKFTVALPLSKENH